MSKFEIDIVNYFENEQLIAEIYYNSSQWAELSQGKEGLVIKFHSHPNRNHWEFPCEEAIKALNQAKTKLLNRIKKGSFLQTKVLLDPKQINEQAKKILEGILNHPGKKMVEGRLERFGNVVDIYAPDMGGVRYSINGEFIGFLEQ